MKAQNVSKEVTQILKVQTSAKSSKDKAQKQSPNQSVQPLIVISKYPDRLYV